MLEFFFFSLFTTFPQEKIERKFILGKNHHIHRDGCRPSILSQFDGASGKLEGNSYGACDHVAEAWRPIPKERRKKVFGKNGCSCPFYRPEIFSLRKFFRECELAHGCVGGSRVAGTHLWISRPHSATHTDPDLSYRCSCQSLVRVFSDNLLVLIHLLRIFLPLTFPWTWWFVCDDGDVRAACVGGA